MTLVTSLLAAIVVTVLWYRDAPENRWKLALPAWLFWGASLMWTVDAVVEYLELGADYFRPEPAELLNDFYLGISVLALGLLIWVVRLLILDPKGVIWKKRS